MRTARVVGLSQDGSALIVATDSGEELAVPADDRLRAALRGDRPRLGQLEIEMDSVLSPREIQARIRAGQSLDEVARVAGLPADRVERFAAPVLAEREYVAQQAIAASVRRRGETSTHRNLRATLTERLLGRGVDLDTLAWDSYRLEDGRWAVTADYRSGESERQAMFTFDLQGRYSVAGNDEARWILGEQSSAKGPQPGRRRPDGSGDDDAEPTLDLDDELALVRAISGPPTPVAGTEAEPERLATVQPIRPLQEPKELAAAPEALSPDLEETAEADGADDASGAAAPDDALTQPEQRSLPWPHSQMDTLDEFLDGDGYSEDSIRVYAGLSEPPAVPQAAVERGAGWEPAIVVNYPVEPSPSDDAADGTDEPGEPDPPTGLADREAEADALEDEHVHPESPPAPTPSEASARPGRRKRASVPSWDEIMFGSPRKPN